MTTSSADLNWVANYIWGIADYVLLDVPDLVEQRLHVEHRLLGVLEHRVEQDILARKSIWPSLSTTPRSGTGR